MHTRVLDRDAEAGTITLHHFDPATLVTTIEVRHEVSALVEAAQFERNLHSDYRPFSHGDWHKIASIPLSVLVDLQRRGITEDQAAFKRWLNDPDNRVFRTMPGHV